MGINGAGKTSMVFQFGRSGYQRINRDLTGGDLEGQTEITADALSNGVDKVMLDNTYPTKASRASLIKLAKEIGAKISCYWLTTSLEDAQLNVCLRMIKKYGNLLTLEEIKNSNDPNTFPPAALFHYRKVFQKPTTAEGFDEVIEVPFVRVWTPEYCNKAVIFDYDGTLRDNVNGSTIYPKNISEIKVRPEMTKIIKDFERKGFIILGASNQSGIGKGIISEAMAIKCFEETNRQLGVKLDFLYCPHKIPPVSCYCRKPHVGMGAIFIERYKLRPSDCIMVGDQTTDKTFAERCGFKFVYANELCK
jgi:D-glycero-D-manno-heptose 1,7-bisphosphate phosphatase